MPRLGSGLGHSSSPFRGISGYNNATSFGSVLTSFLSRICSPSNRTTRNVLVGLIVFFFLRNILRHDYRAEEMAYLRESGLTEEQIDRHIPKTAAERKAYVENRKNDVETMKKDIAFLLSEVAELKSSRDAGKEIDHNSSSGGNDDGNEGAGSRSHVRSHADRGAPLNAMDTIHAEKRKQHEEQLMKDHPDFKPSKRLRDMVEPQHGDAGVKIE